MDYTYMPIYDGTEKMLRRLLGRLTSVMDDQAVRDARERERIPVIGGLKGYEVRMAASATG